MSQRILLIRTDRMGDLVLSTPTIRAIRQAGPNAKISFLVNHANRSLLENHPALDEVIVFDKRGEHKSFSGMMKLARELRSKQFDQALILHSTNRTVLLPWLAGIPKRVGYARRLPWLLTHRLEYNKRLGEKHEMEYTLDLVRLAGFEVKSKNHTLEIAYQLEAQAAVDNWLKAKGIAFSEQIAVLHPGASCPSKRWDPERFAAVADQLYRQHSLPVVVIAGPGETHLAKAVQQAAETQVVVTEEPLPLVQLPWLMKRARVLISNDSGPVHVASAVGVPVVAIFGRWGGGLSPTRWGPTGKDSVVLHHDVGCRPCLAHRCQVDFECLKAVSVDEVVEAASRLLI